jgi:hypothetical protein
MLGPGPDRPCRPREMWIGEGTDRNAYAVRNARIVPIDGRPAGRAEMEGQHRTALGRSLELAALALLCSDLLAREERCRSEQGAGAPLASNAVARRNKRRLPVEANAQLPAGTCGFMLSRHDHHPAVVEDILPAGIQDDKPIGAVSDISRRAWPSNAIRPIRTSVRSRHARRNRCAPSQADRVRRRCRHRGTTRWGNPGHRGTCARNHRS